MNDEIAFHIEMETERLVLQGLPEAEARRRALVRFGGVTQHKETLRSERGLAWMSGLSLDAKLAVRMLVKHPGLATVAVLGMSVAVAIGAVSFSVVHTLVDGKLPVSEGNRVVAIRNIDTHSKIDGRLTHLADLATWRRELTAVSEIGAYRIINRNVITNDGRSEALPVAEMTASGFRIMRVPPLMGRYFNDDDERPDAAPVVVIGHDLWETRFASRADIVGTTIQLGDVKHTIVGVMPSGFAFPISNRVWTPLRLRASDYAPAKAPRVDVFGRLAAGASIGDARRQTASIVQRLAVASPETHAFMRTRVVPYTNSFIDNPDTAWLYYLAQLLITGLLVVIGTNVAVLVYARTVSRMGEIAVRTALGASRARVIVQLFAEALAMSVLASALGLMIAHIALGKINETVTNESSDIPFWFRFHVTPVVVVYCVGLAILAAVIVGVVPGLRATGRSVRTSLQDLAAGGSALRLGKAWTFMIVAQVAIAVAVLPLAIAGISSWRRMQTLQTGLASRQVLTMGLDVDRAESNPDSQQTTARFLALRDEFIRRVAAEPAVAAVAIATSAPTSESMTNVEVSGVADIAMSTRIDDRYLSTMGLPIFAGRGFEPADYRGASNAVLVNRSFVRQRFDGKNPLGQHIREVSGDAKPTPTGPLLEIVGIVPDFPVDSGPLDPKIYRPLSAGDPGGGTVVVRLKNGAPTAFINPLRSLAVATNPAIRLTTIKPIEQTFYDDQAAMRLFIVAVELITSSTLLLSSAGIYALMSFTITRRRREIGIRSALGAGPRRVLVGVLSRAFAQISAGVVVGASIAWAFDQLLKGGWTGRQGAVLLPAVVVLMLIVGLLATVGPAMRALRIAPTEALKAS